MFLFFFEVCEGGGKKCRTSGKGENPRPTRHQREALDLRKRPSKQEGRGEGGEG